MIIPFYNVSKYIIQCYQSLVEQDYDNYTLVFSDDGSDDGSLDLVPDHPKVSKIRRAQRGRALENIHQAIMTTAMQDEDIVTIVDGDDFLLHDRVFYKLNAIYNQRNCLLTYGQFCTNNGCMGMCTGYTREDFERLRSAFWRASHLKTFRYKLYKAFLEQDAQLDAYRDEQSRFYPMAYDIALMYPLMEIAGYENIYFNKDVLYVYRLYEMNDHLNRDMQVACEQHIQAKKPFVRVF